MNEPELSIPEDVRDVWMTAPKRVWLDLGQPDEQMLDETYAGKNFRDFDEVTWSEDNATGWGIAYVRADLAALASPPPSQPDADLDDASPAVLKAMVRFWKTRAGLASQPVGGALTGRAAIVEAWNDLPPFIKEAASVQALYAAVRNCDDATPSRSPEAETDAQVDQEGVVLNWRYFYEAGVKAGQRAPQASHQPAPQPVAADELDDRLQRSFVELGMIRPIHGTPDPANISKTLSRARGAIHDALQALAATPQSEQPAEQEFFCNKCGYFGPDQYPHNRPLGSGECSYMASPIKKGGLT